MEKLDEIQAQINTLRRQMHLLIDQNENLVNPSVIKISQRLDDTLNLYYQAEQTIFSVHTIV